MDDLVKRLREGCVTGNYEGLKFIEHSKADKTMNEAADRIEMLEAALRTIDNMIPKDNPSLPAMAMVAGDIAECALSGKWPAFGIIPRIALRENNDA